MSVRFRRPRAGAGLAGAVTAVAAAIALAAGPASASAGGFLGPLDTIRTVASTVPANGDVNPYGVAVVPTTIGRLHRGDVLVSNFNNATNAQGTGTTVVEISPGGHRSVFARIAASQVPGGVGLTTALVALRAGWVIVGNLPTADDHLGDGDGRVTAGDRSVGQAAHDLDRSRHQRAVGRDRRRLR
jgi:hypothetical protein